MQPLQQPHQEVVAGPSQQSQPSQLLQSNQLVPTDSMAVGPSQVWPPSQLRYAAGQAPAYVIGHKVLYFSDSKRNWFECTVASLDVDGGVTVNIAGVERYVPQEMVATHLKCDTVTGQAADANATNWPSAAAPEQEPQQAAPPPQQQKREVKPKSTVLYCPHDGNLLQAKVVTEIWNKVTWWMNYSTCTCCSKPITHRDARYICPKCKYCVCMDCSAKQLGRRETRPLPPTAGLRPEQEARPDKVSAGDILLVGPDSWGIHHVVLSRGRMRPDPEAGEWIKSEWAQDGGKVLPNIEELDFFSCDCIESTRSSRGKEQIWYPSRKFFARNKRAGQAFWVAETYMDEGDLLELAYEPVQVKLLLHPLRPGHGGPTFVPEAFVEAMKLSAKDSKHWSIKTALKGFRSKKKSLIEAESHSDRESRIELLQDLRRRWDERPICSSVAIIVWQRYFDLAAGHGPDAEDRAAQDIIRWMPLLPDKTLPAILIQELSKCGWVMRGNLDV
mmetsp:Transcript_25217/g.46272  ORF Transcript_25217/g.46272 Transcript_25217/m.46272 type:complete len:501 (-) Transcript_25217:64-1566(-)